MTYFIVCARDVLKQTALIHINLALKKKKTSFKPILDYTHTNTRIIKMGRCFLRHKYTGCDPKLLIHSREQIGIIYI